MVKVRINPRIFTLPVNTGNQGGGYGTGNYPESFKNIIWRVTKTGFHPIKGDLIYCVPCITRSSVDEVIGEVIIPTNDLIYIAGEL